MSLFQKKKTFEVMGIVQSIHDYKPMEAQYFFGKKFTKGFASGESELFSGRSVLWKIRGSGEWKCYSKENAIQSIGHRAG